jgi:hypothetical protein
MRTDMEMRDDARTRLEDTMGLEKSGLFDTHPSNGDRIRAARRADEPGVFRCDLPATLLFTNFEVPAKQVTILHYSDDLEIPPGLARLVPLQPISEPISEPEPVEEMKAMAGLGSRLRLRK